ncbi:uncharacterized protein LOC144148407 [Haemaphysalis longicornis]
MSGHVGWPHVSVMTNPLLFFMQFLLLDLATAGTTTEKEPTLVIHTRTTNGDCAQELPLYDEHWASGLPSSTTSPQQSIRSLSPPDHFSGHVGWPHVSVMTNPLLFFMQFLLLDLATAGTTTEKEPTLVLHTRTTNGDCAQELPLYDEHWASGLPSSTTSPQQSIRSLSPPDHFSGHVGWPHVSVMTNPLLFFMQFLLLDLATAGTTTEKEPTLVIHTRTTNGDCAQELPLYDEHWASGLPSSTTSPQQSIRSLSPPDHFSGHVGWPHVSVMTNPLLFFMQVSNNVSTVKTSNPLFIQLTCPRKLHAICLSVRKVLSRLLLLCGDIESNPGPPTSEELLQELLKGQTTIQQRLDRIELSLKTVEETALAVKQIDVKVTALDNTVQILQNKLTELEDRSRRNNILVYGIDEKDDETNDDLEAAVVQGVFNTVLGVNVRSAERIHRIGRKRPDKARPVIVKLFDYREKMDVFSKCSKLKGTEVSISEDYSVATRQKRKKLWDSTTELRSTGNKPKLIYDKLKIGNQLYLWDESQNKRVPAGKQGSTQSHDN